MALLDRSEHTESKMSVEPLPDLEPEERLPLAVSAMVILALSAALWGVGWYVFSKLFS